jgi:hypothetical protein
MQKQWFADRLTLARLLTQHPDWRVQDFATATRRSVAWVKKWKQRLSTSNDPPETACQSRSCARHTPPPGWTVPVIARILELRDQPPDGLHRVPGADTILWYLRIRR